MFFQKQTILSDIKNGIKGNCLTACVASLFGIPIEEVPYFAEIEDVWQSFSDFCNQHGYKFCGWIINPTQYHLSNFAGINGGYAIVGGKSPRGDYGHAVIYKNGQPFFDVHPSNDFTKTVERLYIIKQC